MGDIEITHDWVTAEPDAGKDVDADNLNDHRVISIEIAGEEITSGTVADARIAATIARDSEVTSAVAAEAALARNADNLSSGTVADARIASTIARDSEVTSAVGAEATARDAAIETHRADTTNVHGITDTSAVALTGHSHAGEDITSGTVADGRVASTLARDSEVTSAISTHEGASDPHPGYLTSAEGNAAYDASGAAATAASGAASALASHEADTTSVHGVADTSALYRAGGTDVAIADGGTGASTAANARTNLGLGTAATAATGDFDAAGAAAAAQAASQPLDSDLTAVAALTTTSFGRGLLTLADAAALAATHSHAGGSANRNVTVLGVSAPSAVTGTWTNTADASAGLMLGSYVLNTPAQNEAISWEVLLDAGTYTLTLLHHRHTTRGIYTVTMDGGASLGTIDGYNAGGGLATVSVITGIVVSVAGLHTMTFTMATKNASSSNYFATIHAFTMGRTGA
jgi:hypothetical protein